MNAPTYLPPADFEPEPCTHPLEVAVHRMPNGARHVELVDHTEKTWQQYCADLVERTRLQAQRHRDEFRAHLRALATAEWND